MLWCLAGHGVDWLLLLDLDIDRESLDHDEYEDSEEGGTESGEEIVVTAALVSAHKLADDPANDIHPSDGGCEAETSDDGVERLGLNHSSKRNKGGCHLLIQKNLIFSQKIQVLLEGLWNNNRREWG